MPICPAANKKALFQQLAAAAGAAHRRAGQGDRRRASTRARRSARPASAAAPRSRTARSRAWPRVFGYFARLADADRIPGVDGLPVDLVFLLLSPPDAGADHLKALASGQPRLPRPPDARQAARRPLARMPCSPCSPARKRGMPPEGGRRRRISGRSNRSTARRRSTACSIRRSRSPSRASRASASR